MPVTINTDNPGLFAIDLTNELDVCVRELGFTDEDLRRVTRNALEASFVDEDRKRDVDRPALRLGGRVGFAVRTAMRRKAPR